jgi:PIN domain nuclease of toxin-antitoxin system
MLDTHIAVALYDGRTAGLSNKTLRKIDREPVAISPVVVLELELLYEIGRLSAGGDAIASALQTQLTVAVAKDRFLEVANAALALAFTRDPFDRLIVAHATLRRAPLVTHDTSLQRHYPQAIA